MSTVERKEYQETKVLRTRSPVRNFRSSSQNLVEFDHNLDYLLEDLQNSVSRPGSSIGNYKTNSLNRITNVKSSNPVTEYSSDDAYNYTAPDGKHVTGYKKESYYKSSSSGMPTSEKRMQNNINQLDNLLDDLQQVKQSSYQSSYEREAYNNTGASPDFYDGKTAVSSKKNVNRELHYGDTSKSTLERNEKESSQLREYQYSSEGTYGQVRTGSPTPSSRTSTLSKQAKVQNVHAYPLKVIETTAPDIDPEVLAHLDPNLHPPGNTKVTTTIKTYTYEIPGSGDYSTNLTLDESQSQSEKYVYSPNNTITTPSKSFTYNKIENKENIVNDRRLENYNYKEKEIFQSNKYYQKPAAPTGQTVVKETITTRNYQPGYIPEPNPPSNQSYVYNETVTTKSHDNYVPTTRTDALYIEEKDIIEYPPPTATTQKIYYKDQSTNTIERHHNGYPQNNDYTKSIYNKEESRSNYKPPEPVNIQYKYKSESKTVNNYKAGYPPSGETEPLIPKPFPNVSENVSHTDGPPKRLDELMQTIGGEPPNSPYNAGYTAHEFEMQQKRKAESLRQQSEADDMLQKKEPIQKTKNVTGPPVYYPPGHEMFAKKEEGGAAWRAEGAYARGAGKYEYEAESKSKMKSSSGKAIVPVCLPLCCGLPCVIL